MIKFYPLTYVQNTIWEVENFVSTTNINNITGTLIFKEILDFELLEKAVNLLVKKTMRFEPVLE